jgi:hypothetical protein
VEIDYAELDGWLDLGPRGRTDAYRVTVTHDGALAMGVSRTIRYRIDVCFRAGGDDRCIRGTTLGREGGP